MPRASLYCFAIAVWFGGAGLFYLTQNIAAHYYAGMMTGGASGFFLGMAAHRAYR